MYKITDETANKNIKMNTPSKIAENKFSIVKNAKENIHEIIKC